MDTLIHASRSKRAQGLALIALPLGVLLLGCVAPAAAQSEPPLPDDLAGVGLDDKRDAQVPLDLEFVDEAGRPVVLGQFFSEEKPVLLTLVYFRCPMLCTLVLDGMVNALQPLDWVPGDQFEIVTVSIDPFETPDLAQKKKRSYVTSYGKPEAAEGWHFLSGNPRSISTLADAVGFRYQKVEETNEFAHPAALFILTPEGRLSRYLTGVQHDPKTMRLSLVEASEGKVGNVLDKFLLYCYRYDAEEGRYAPVAMKIMRLGGGLAVTILAAVLLTFWLGNTPQAKEASVMIGEIMSALAAVWVRLTGASGISGDGSFWLPRQGSTLAEDVDLNWDLVYWISVFFLALVTFLLVFFVIRFRARPGHREEASASHNTPLEIVWSVIPTLLVIVLFWQGYKTFLNLATPPQNNYEVLVTAQRWNWQFTYPNGYVDPNLHVPKDTAVQLVMSSEDVIHSFFVPEFRVKRDVFPGRYTKVWFEAKELGEYDIFCTEYCGTEHSSMLAKLIVHERGTFDSWLEAASDWMSTMSPAEAGAVLYTQRGCKQCHSLDGAAAIGPTFKGVFGHVQPLADGSTIEVDENYIRESLLEPQAKIAAGFDPVMPTYQGRLKDEEITAIIEYLKTLAE